MKATAKVENGNLIITLPIHAPQPSSTGKSLVVASTSGFTETEAKVDNKVVKVSVNAIVAR